jgi:signal transduction histidine kinase
MTLMEQHVPVSAVSGGKVTKPLPLEEQEYRQSLYRLEKRAIIPLKWSILAITLILWTWIIGSWPTSRVFILFLVYFMLNCAETYVFFFSRVSSGQIRPFTLASYMVDVVFVTMLIYFDLATSDFTTATHHDFYILYFLMVMRGFALFKKIHETIFVNLLISILYLSTFYIRDFSFKFIDKDFAVSLLLIWLVILMSWFLVMIITRQKSELMEVHEQLLRADSLARVGEIAAGVAHEINNPIGIIAANAEYLKTNTGPQDDRLDEFEAIHREAMRCKEIIQQMLTYANPRPQGNTDVNPVNLNDEVLFFVFPKKHNSRFTVECQYEKNCPLFIADPNLIKQALLNLYMNARQSIPQDQQGMICSRIFSDPLKNKVCIEVEDNGHGIFDDDMQYIFEPFFTRKEQGTGLGLAVTQRIVERFGGVISVRSGMSQGSIFSLEFPVARQDGTV